MSADLLARNCVKVLREIKDEKIGNLRRLKPRPPTQVGDSGAVVAAAGCEEIALYAVDTNSAITTIDMAIATIEAEYKKIVSPEQPEPQDEKPKNQARAYG